MELFFFYFKTIGFALFEIVTLWITIDIMLSLFYKIKPMAAYINIPYFLWVTFATILNSAYNFLNRGYTSADNKIYTGNSWTRLNRVPCSGFHL